jgi:hypothetical protein
MNLTRFLLILVLSTVSFVVVNIAHAETRTVSFSPLSYIFDTGYLIHESLQLFPDSEVLNYNSENYPGAILAGSQRAVLATLSEIPEAQHREVLDEVFCHVTSSIVVAYGERYEYEVQLVHIAINGDLLSFTTEAVQLTTERRGCD